MKTFKRIFSLLILVFIVGLGASLTLKAAIGVGAWDHSRSPFQYYPE